MLINIKPLSVNDCWRGGPRYKTQVYLDYKQELKYKLPRLDIDFTKKLSLTMDVGMNGKMDIDNCVKPFLDTLQEHYGFNDKQVEQIHLYKNTCRKGHEFINFQLQELDNDI